MLPKKNRIPRKDFPASNRQGFRVFSPLFSVVFYKNGKEPSVSVVVSKKVAKNAVTRNRIRRIFYALAERNLKNLKSPAMMIFYPKKESTGTESQTLTKEIEIALIKANLL
ncbi:MAG: ribonuclease P protein component [Patescibacteria group bacterium]